MTATRTVTIARLRWRAPWWSPNTATAVRVYARPADAQKAATRRAFAGYEVELSFAERTTWRIVRRAAWTTAPGGRRTS